MGEVELVSVAEAARRLALSPSTVRRRIDAGELRAHVEERPQGTRYLVEITAEAVEAAKEEKNASDTAHGASGDAALVAALEERIASLERRLDAREQAESELRQLLGREQEAHRATRAQLAHAQAQLLPAPDASAGTTTTSQETHHEARRRRWWLLGRYV